MTDKELIKALSKDWLERDGDNFVRIRKTGRLGWEESLKEGTPYSSYLLDSPSQEELIQRAYPMAKQTLSAMDTPFRINVRLSGNCSCTEAKNLYVATNYFDDTEISTGKKLDIFLGLTAHEGSHLLYTQFDQMTKAADVHPLCAALLNIIEDERIERILGEEKPGLANYLKAVKDYYFGKYAATSRHEDCAECSPNQLEIIINCILGLVRYPRLLKESEMIEYGELLLQVEEILTPYPETTVMAELAAEKIFALIQEKYKEDNNDESSDSCGSKSKEGTEGAEKDEAPTKAEDSEKSEEETPSEDAPLSGDDSSVADTDRRDKTSYDESESTEESEDDAAIAESTMDSLRKDYLRIAGSLTEVAGGPVQPEIEGCKSLDEADKANAIKEDHGILADICEGMAELGTSKDVLFKKQTEKPYAYLKALEEVRPYIPAIRRVVKGQCKEYQLTHLGMRSGVLDTNKLVEAIQGVPTVYTRRGAVRSDRACVCILVDESGSMLRDNRMTAARQTAVLLNEALSGIPNIELFIYGHTADCSSDGKTELNIYREKGYCPKHSLGSLEPLYNNRDGVAILETVMRVRKQTDEDVLMFIISDGEPVAKDYIGMHAIMHTRECVQKAESMGVRIVQICINSSYDPALMFKHYVKMEDLSSLAKDLGREIARALQSKIKSHVV